MTSQLQLGRLVSKASGGALTLGKVALYRTQVGLPPAVLLACAHTRQSQLGLITVACCTYVITSDGFNDYFP